MPLAAPEPEPAPRPAARPSAAAAALAFALALAAAGGGAGACGGDPTLGPDPALGGDGGGDGGSGDAATSADAGPLCRDGVPTSAYPPGGERVELGGVLPPLVLLGEVGPVPLGTFYDPCAREARLLVLRLGAAFCGSCEPGLRRTPEIVPPDLASRVTFVDVLVRDEDNQPPDADALARYRKLVPGTTAVTRVDDLALLATSDTPEPLPRVLFVDVRTMRVEGAVSALGVDELGDRIRLELAFLDRAPRPTARPNTLVDGLFDAEQWATIQGMRWTNPPPPPDPSNAVADSPAAARLGKQLFSDVSLSPSGSVSCASCHDATKGLADGAPRSTAGLAPLDRNAPGIALAAHARWQFWDGRADTLWAQAAGPFEDAREMGGSRLFVAHRVKAAHAAEWAAAFPGSPLPDLDDGARFPPAGKPGDAAWAAMTEADRRAVTGVLVGVAKAIAAFERTFVVEPNAFDRYAGGELGALDALQKHGLHTFFTLGCAQCHAGPRLTNDAFHVLRFPGARVDGRPDDGRSTGLALLAASELRSDGAFSDAPTLLRVPRPAPPGAHAFGAFKTPSLRGLGDTAPYGHAGTLATLEEVTHHYALRGHGTGAAGTVGGTEPWVPQFDTGAERDLLPFLRVLTARTTIP